MQKQDIIQLERKHSFFQEKCVKVQSESHISLKEMGFDSINQSDANKNSVLLFYFIWAKFWGNEGCPPCTAFGFQPCALIHLQLQLQ